MRAMALRCEVHIGDGTLSSSQLRDGFVPEDAVMMPDKCCFQSWQINFKITAGYMTFIDSCRDKRPQFGQAHLYYSHHRCLILVSHAPHSCQSVRRQRVKRTQYVFFRERDDVWHGWLRGLTTIRLQKCTITCHVIVTKRTIIWRNVLDILAEASQRTDSHQEFSRLLAAG